MKLRLTEPAIIAFKVALIYGLTFLGTAGNLASYAVLGYWCLRGPVQTLEALTMATFLSSLNPAIFPGFEAGGALRWGLLIFAAGVTLLRYRAKRHGLPPALGRLALLVGAVLVLSIWSYAQDVSISRLVTFGLGAMTALLSARMAQSQLHRLRTWFLCSFATIIVFSFPLIFTSYGYVRNNVAFQGFLSQPQSYAVILAPYVAWLVASIYARQLRGPVWLGVAGLAAISLFQTDARTGAIAAMAGALTGVMLQAWRKRMSIGKRIGSTVFVLLGGALVLLAITAAFYQQIETMVGAFIFKNGKAFDIQTAFELSRGRLMQISWENFLEKPLVGIGFGLPSDPVQLVVNYIAGIPFSSSSEKGMLITAVLEEVGVIGFAAFLLLVWSLLQPAFRKLNGPAAAMGTAAFLTNFGESTFYSMGGVGLMIWMMMAYALAEAERGQVLVRPASRARSVDYREGPSQGRPSTRVTFPQTESSS